MSDVVEIDVGDGTLQRARPSDVRITPLPGGRWAIRVKLHLLESRKPIVRSAEVDDKSLVRDEVAKLLS